MSTCPVHRVLFGRSGDGMSFVCTHTQVCGRRGWSSDSSSRSFKHGTSVTTVWSCGVRRVGRSVPCLALPCLTYCLLSQIKKDAANRQLAAEGSSISHLMWALRQFRGNATIQELLLRILAEIAYDEDVAPKVFAAGATKLAIEIGRNVRAGYAYIQRTSKHPPRHSAWRFKCMAWGCWETDASRMWGYMRMCVAQHR